MLPSRKLPLYRRQTQYLWGSPVHQQLLFSLLYILRPIGYRKTKNIFNKNNSEAISTRYLHRVSFMFNLWFIHTVHPPTLQQRNIQATSFCCRATRHVNCEAMSKLCVRWYFAFNDEKVRNKYNGITEKWTGI